MATVIESGVGLNNYGRQSAKGTKATAATTSVGYNRLKMVSGGLAGRKVLGSQNYADGNRFSSPTNFVNYVGGGVGSVTFQAQPENIGLFYAQILGSDTVTGSADPYTHTITPNNNGGSWGTWWQKLGSAVGPERQVFWDSKVSTLTQSSPRDQNVVNLELAVVALKVAEVYTTDPAKTEDASDPYLLTESTSGLTFDGTVIQEIEDSIVTIDAAIEPFWGDDVEPLQLIEGRGDPGISRSVEAIVTDDTLAKYRKALYDSATPTAGTRPGNVVFAPAVSQVFTRSATRTATITNPKVAINPEDFEAMSMQTDGGKKTIRFGGQCLKSGGSPQITVVVLSGDATSYA